MTRFAVLLLLLCPTLARAACVPSTATPGMMGCEPIATSVLPTDYIQVWLPGLFPAAAQLISVTNFFAGRTLTSPAISGGTIDGAVIGGVTPAAGSFTTLSATSTISGAGFTAWLASPPIIGGTAPAAGHFSTLSATGVLTLSAQPAFASSSTGSGTQTFVNSPCTGLTTAKWIPVTITGQSGTWNIPACQ